MPERWILVLHIVSWLRIGCVHMVRCILSSVWFDVLELLKSFGNVAWHGQVYLAAFVIPIYGDADVS